MDIGSILRNTRIEAKLTLKYVESVTGIPASHQSKIELGESPAPGFYTMAVLAEFYGLSLDGIYEATKTKSSNPVTAAHAKQKNLIPIITYSDIPEWLKNPQREHEFEVALSPFRCSDKSFVLRVIGDSMTSPAGSTSSYPEGSLIFVDPDVVARHNTPVIVRFENKTETVFRKFVSDGAEYLQPLNPQYPVIKFDESMMVVGSVIGSIQGI